MGNDPAQGRLKRANCETQKADDVVVCETLK